MPYDPPIQYAEITFCFDWDFPVEQLDQQIGLEAAEIKRQKETRVNPQTQKKNPGYWTYLTPKFLTYDAGLLFGYLKATFAEYGKRFEQVLQTYKPCGMYINIVCLIQHEDEYPILRMDPELLALFSAFSATVDIVIESDYI